MKDLSRFVLAIGIAVGWLVLTADSILAKDTLYHEYEYDASTEPVMSLSLRRIFHKEELFIIAYVNGDYADWQAMEQNKKEAEEKEAEEKAKAEELKEAAAGDNSEDDAQTAGQENGETTGAQEHSESENSENADAQDVAVSESSGENGETVGDQQEAETANNTGNEQVTDAETSAEATEELEEEKYVLAEVPDEYFADALFIGDSRTVGLSEYCEQLVDVATFYSKISLTIYDFDKKEFVEVPIKQEGEEEAEPEDISTEKVTIEEALSRQEFGKVYIMLGLNELGSGSVESFCESYGNVINRIHELQPEATIYIQGIMHVTAEKSDHDKIFKNSTINERNEGLKGLADNQHVFYIDMNEATDDENGNLTSELSFDNIHLKAKSYALWYDYLKTHAYVKESKYEAISANINESEIEKQAE